MTQPLRILLIDDNRSDRALALRELQRDFNQLDVQEISSSGEFNRAIEAGAFDAVITDFQLRWTTGLDILETVRQRYPRCPVIMFTNTGTEEVAVEAMKLGLDDYILKEPNRYVRLPASLRVALERRETQQRAALLEIRLQGLLNQVNIGIFRFSSEGALIESNPAFLELLGVESLDQANEMNLIDICDCYVRLANLPPPQRQEQEVQLQRSDGTQFWALLTTTLNTVEGITVLDGLLDDITERKQAEVALQQLNATLEARVQERTAELAAANQDLEEFTYSISHDLRTPLRTIQGFAQVLLEDLGESLDASHLTFLQRIAANAQQLDTLITDLLTYSRLRQAEIDLEPVNLSLVLTDVLTQLEPEIQTRQAQLQIEEPLPLVQANRLILIQVLTNLLSNAVKFVADDVQPQVRVWAEERRSGGAGERSSVRLYVEDNGIGVAVDNQQQIFRPFIRLHGEEKYPGNGIGLAIVRKGIERMGGQVGVESQLGQGSRFWIELPAIGE
ncbi:multi-sensor signal transduction histidine kinase [Gloeocapsa sp. PCC 7428]|uniref:sensor histidine kinase n=1 Tax=Gloeocapsa sp. PCC 7428 TaxID=1173026 RepID=UPI0002A60C9C|nr:ATP-binding protein [Gloeocapsa sp. PCC 7428]AFZ30619.1 multi-sensor signal transduction histidine kinase [Gloeocapsa sp. PCC 7428]